MTEAEWDKVMTVNTKDVFLCCQEVIQRMRKYRRGGRLINTASGQARQGFIFTPHYAASKFGVVGITQSPGIIDTDMWAYNDQAWGKLLGDYKPGRMGAKLLIFLAVTSPSVPFCSRSFHPIRCDFVAAVSSENGEHRRDSSEPNSSSRWMHAYLRLNGSVRNEISHLRG
jgi:hypothetical protein